MVLIFSEFHRNDLTSEVYTENKIKERKELRGCHEHAIIRNSTIHHTSYHSIFFSVFPSFQNEINIIILILVKGIVF